jgi:hypothetical protein
MGPQYVATSEELPAFIDESYFRVVDSFTPDLVLGVSAISSLTSMIQLEYLFTNETFD